MEDLNDAFNKVRISLAEWHAAFKQSMAWYKQEMDNLKAQLAAKDKEIEELKQHGS